MNARITSRGAEAEGILGVNTPHFFDFTPPLFRLSVMLYCIVSC